MAALDSYLEWLMVFREGAEFSNDAGFSQRYPTMPARGGGHRLRSHWDMP